MDRETQDFLKAFYQQVSIKCWKARLAGQPVVRFRTQAWTYTIIKKPDGYAIQPENSSQNYPDYVDMLIDCLTVIAQVKSPIAK